jgi:hypothetical protein
MADNVRSIITVMIFDDDTPVSIEVEGGGVIDMFGAATLLERAAHKVLAQAEHAAVMASIDGEGRPEPTKLTIARQLPPRGDA